MLISIRYETNIFLRQFQLTAEKVIWSPGIKNHKDDLVDIIYLNFQKILVPSSKQGFNSHGLVIKQTRSRGQELVHSSPNKEKQTVGFLTGFVLGLVLSNLLRDDKESSMSREMVWFADGTRLRRKPKQSECAPKGFLQTRMNGQQNSKCLGNKNP